MLWIRGWAWVGGADAGSGSYYGCTGVTLMEQFGGLLVDVLAPPTGVGKIVESRRDDRLGITERRRGAEKLHERFLFELALGCLRAALVFTVGVEGIGIFVPPLFTCCLRRFVEAGGSLGQGWRASQGPSGAVEKGGPRIGRSDGAVGESAVLGAGDRAPGVVRKAVPQIGRDMGILGGGGGGGGTGRLVLLDVLMVERPSVEEID